MMDKAEVASVLDDIAALLELKGENPFKIRAYQNAARALLSSPEDIDRLVKENRLHAIKGIGESIAEKITTLVSSGHLPYYEDLKKSLDPGLLELTRLQGVGPKKAVLLHDKLKIKDVGGLKKAAEQGRIARLKGFGETSQQNILKAIGFQAEHASEHLLSEAQEAADLVIDRMKRLPLVKRISACGSLRRHKEIVHDVDILVAADRDAEKIMEHFVKLPEVVRILGQGDTKSSVLLRSGMQVDLRVVKEEEYPYALLYFTGSKEHNIVLRQIAQGRKMKLSEYGLFKTGGKRVPCKDEADIYEKLGLPYFQPEIREDRGEFDAAAKKALPRLIETDDIRGIFHVHSTWSDGTIDLSDMIQEAQDMGFEYVGISDHSQIAAYAGGLSVERVRQQGKVIEALRKKFKIQIFWGSECDILKDGRMDYNDDILRNYDFTIASVHSHFTMPEPEMTARVIKALKNKYVTILGHLTGRLLLKRPSFALNAEEVFKVAGSEGVAIEINSLPDRLEIDWRWMPRAKALGCKFSIDPDAHSKEDLHGYPRGIGIARKGWLTAKDVITALPLAEMKSYLKSRH